MRPPDRYSTGPKHGWEIGRPQGEHPATGATWSILPPQRESRLVPGELSSEGATEHVRQWY